MLIQMRPKEAKNPAEVTLEQASVILAVSSTYLLQLLENGSLSSQLVGNERRIAQEDLLRYQQEEDARRERNMQELIAETERLGL